MSAVLLWSALPVLVAGGLILIRRKPVLVTILATIFCLLLVSAALWLPIDQTIRLGPVSFQVSSTLVILGRKLVFDEGHRGVLALIYMYCAFWFAGARVAGVTRFFVPIGMAMVGLLAGSLAVQPFLYAALIIEAAVLVSIPLLVPGWAVEPAGRFAVSDFSNSGRPVYPFIGLGFCQCRTPPERSYPIDQGGDHVKRWFCILAGSFSVLYLDTHSGRA